MLYLLDKVATKQAFENQLASLKNPPKTKAELLSTLKKCRLPKSAVLFE